MCARWKRSYVAFIADVGHRPSKDYELRMVDGSRRLKPGSAEWRIASSRKIGGRAKLTEDKASEIRELKGCVSQRKLAVQFGVSRSAIQLVQSGRNWQTAPMTRRAVERGMSDVLEGLGV